MNDVALPVAHADTLLAQIERLVRSDIEPARFQAVLDMFDRERRRAQLEAFNRAMAGLQSELYQIAATGVNPTFRSAYPKLHDLLKESRSYLAKYGFSVRFGTEPQKSEPPPIRDGWQRVVLIISHIDGHSEEHHMDGPPDISSGNRARSPVQSIGSTNTYLRRYLFMMALNLVPGGDPTDDDGSGGSDATVTPEQLDEIERLLTEISPSSQEVAALLQQLSATTVRDIRARDYARLINTLINRKKRKEEEAGNGDA